MTKAATPVPTPVQQAALLCYRLATCPLDPSLISEEGLVAMGDIVGSQVSAEMLLQFCSKLRQSEQYVPRQADIIANWRERMDAIEALDEKEALSFVQTLFSDLDHAIVYDHGITVGSTQLERGLIGDTEMQFPGSMPCWTLHLTLQGKALFLNDQIGTEVTRGDMMLFHPEACYHYGLHPASDHWEHLWVLFQPRPHWSDWLEWNELDEGIFQLSLEDEASVSLMEELFRQLINMANETSPYQSDLQHNRLEEIIIRARECSSQPDLQLSDKRILLACDFIQKNLAEKFSVEDVAIACNLSPSRLAHLFKQQIGISLKSWSSNLRLQSAQKKLLASNDSISVVASQIGYSDPNQFTKYFKKNMGCSPREFRRSFKNNRAA